jgi:hypothetical protein
MYSTGDDMKTFSVEMICKVRKLITVQCDDEQVARDDPWDHATNEMEIDQIDWEVVSVTEDK